MAVRKKVTSKGRVRYQVYVHDAVGKRQVYIGTFDRQKDAEEAEYEARRRIRLGERLRPREEVRFDVLAKRWQASLVSVRPSTLKDYDKAVRRLRPMIGDRFVSSLTRRDVDEIILDLSRRYAASTVRKTIVVLKMILRMAVDHEYLDKLPLGGSRLALPKMKKRQFRPLTSQQVAMLVDATPPYWQPFVQLLLTTGLRRAEAWGLLLEDVDLKAGVLRVRRQLVKRQLVELKTDAAYRDVLMPRQTVDMLRAHMEQVPDSDLGLLFPTPDGRPVDPPNFYARVWIPAREKAGLPTFRLHDCRHHVASVYLSQGRSVTYVQRLLGHSSPITLLSIYSWVTRGEAEVATSDLEKWLSDGVEAKGTANAGSASRTGDRQDDEDQEHSS